MSNAAQRKRLRVAIESSIAEPNMWLDDVSRVLAEAFPEVPNWPAHLESAAARARARREARTRLAARTRICGRCGTRFEARAGARYCSDACRQAAHRERQRSASG